MIVLETGSNYLLMYWCTRNDRTIQYSVSAAPRYLSAEIPSLDQAFRLRPPGLRQTKP